MRGRKPTPTELRVVRGNPGKRPLNHDEPEVNPGIPDPPAWLEGEALDKWRDLTAILSDVGIITRVDADALTLYCETWAEWKEATLKLRQFGKVVKAPSGYPMPSPYLAIKNHALKHLRALEAELGMTPSARTRVKAVKKPQPSQQSLRERYFGRSRGQTA